MTASAKVTLSADGKRLTLDLDGRSRELAALWLRERAPDAETLDPGTGQRLIEAAELPLDLAVEHAEIDGDALALRFSDGHATRFPLATLEAGGAHHGDIVPGRTLWEADVTALPHADFAAAVADDTALLGMLEGLHRHGVVMVSGVPADEHGMQALIDRIGPLRRTNWGGIADVRSVANAYDLTMTQRGLEPHTDNPYRDPIPGYIWLHCLTNAADGGDSTLVDGYRAAQVLRERDPAAFDYLTRVSPRFHYRDEDTWLESEGPLIELDSQGRISRVRFNNRTERVDALPADELERYYAARHAFYALITSDELTVNLKLDPGQMLIMDNYRLFHGRRAFELAGGVRHLRQGYVDRDSTASRRLTLRHRLSDVAIPEEVA